MGRIFPWVAVILAGLMGSGHAAHLEIGAEIILGAPAPQPWSAFGLRPSIASDGTDILVAYTDTDGVYVVLLDAEGNPREPQRRILSPPAGHFAFDGPLNGIRAVWRNGIYGVFVSDGDRGDAMLIRLTREGDVIDSRRYPLRLAYRNDTPGVAAGFSEVVAVGGGSQAFVFDDQLNPTTTIALPDTGSRAIAHGLGRYAILTANASAVTLRWLNVARPRMTGPVTIAGPASNPARSRFNARLVWAGTEFVALWTECESDGIGRCSTQMARVAPDGTLRAPVEPLSHNGRTMYLANAGLAALGDDRIAVTYDTGAGSPGWYVRRFERGKPIDIVPFTRKGGGLIEGFQTSSGRLLTVDNFMRGTFIPSPGAAATTELTATPISFTVPEELLMGAGLSGNVIGILRHHSDDGYRSHRSTHLQRRDLRPISDRFLYYSSMYAATVVNNGSLNYWGAFEECGSFKALTESVPLIACLGGSARSSAAWTPPYLSTIWFNGSEPPRSVRLERLDANGFLGRECALPAESMSLTTPSGARPFETSLIAVGNELWALIAGADEVRITRVDAAKTECELRGVEVLTVPAVRFPFVATWQKETETLALLFEENHRIGVALRRADGAIALGDARFPASQAATLAATGRHLIALYDRPSSAPAAESIEAMLLDENGRELHSVRVSPGANGKVAPVLVPLDAQRMLAVYTRSIAEAPYNGVRRVGARVLTIVE